MVDDERPKQIYPLVKPDEGVFQVYSNYVDVAWTLFDVTVRFAQIVPLPRDGSGPRFEAEENARITLAWPEAKILANILADLVSRFEKVNGEIKPLHLASSPDDDKKAAQKQKS